MDEIKVDTSSDIHFLQNEKFDFDLPFSPTLAENKIVKKEKENDGDGDDEVFFGPVGFTEKCMSTQVTSLQTDADFKPLSPLSGEQVVELFTEATKLALHIERLSTRTSDNSLNQSHASSGKSSLSNSYLKLSNCSSSSSSVLQFSFEKYSSGSSDGKPSQSEIIDIDKENTQPTTVQGTKRRGGRDEKSTTKSKEVAPLVSKQNNTPMVKRGLPRPGSRGSRLPKSKNTEKSCSAFNSPIKKPDVTKTDNLEAHNLAKMKAQSINKTTRRRSSQHNIQNSVPAKATSSTNNARKTSVPTLAKRNIFRSTESLTEDGTKQTKSCKLPVPDQSKIPGPRPRRRRSSSTSSISSQSSTSSSKSQPPVEECRRRKAKPVPSTKASLASSSLPLGLIRRSNKQEKCNDKKPQPMKVLPRSAKSKTSDGQEPTSTQPPKPMPQMPPSCDETKDEKTFLSATPRLPVARRRSSLRRPSSSSARSSDGSPRPNTSTRTTNYESPQSKTEQTKKGEPSLACGKRRRSFIPTPGRSTRTSKSSSENPQLLSSSPAVNTKGKPNSKEKMRVENVTGDDDHQNAINTTPAQSVDDLLQLDDAVAAMPDVISLQPDPVSQLDLIDLS